MLSIYPYLLIGAYYLIIFSIYIHIYLIQSFRLFCFIIYLDSYDLQLDSIKKKEIIDI